MGSRIVVVALVAALAFSVSFSASGAAAPAAMPNLQSLIARATGIVRAKHAFRNAVLLEADGTATGAVTNAAGITRWRFVYNNQTTPGFKARTAFLYYRNGRFSGFTHSKSPFVEDRNLTTIPKMTLQTAVAKLRDAGHKSGFLNVTLRWPLTSGTIKEPLYIFGFRSGKYFAVGTKTGRVRPIT
jgi:hypothetical protein